MLQASNNQLPLLTRICISSLREWPKNMVINKPENADESAQTKWREEFQVRMEIMDLIVKGKWTYDHYLRPLSPTSLSSVISTFNKLRNDIVEGYCSLLASISFNSNCMSYTCKRHEFVSSHTFYALHKLSFWLNQVNKRKQITKTVKTLVSCDISSRDSSHVEVMKK